MADNIALNAMSGGELAATDKVTYSGDPAHVQLMRIVEVTGAEGSKTVVGDSIGSLTETAPSTDTGSSGLNGRLQRIAQRITTLIGSTLTVAKGQQTVTACTISSGGSLSAAIDLGVSRLVGIAIPGTFEPTQVTFQASYDNSTWNDVYDASGAEKIVNVGINRRVILFPSDFLGIRYLKVRGGTSGSPTNVAANRTLQLISEA